MADGYANAWLIDEYGDYELLIEYMPQRVFYLGLCVTVVSVLAGLAWAIGDMRQVEIRRDVA